MHQPRSLIELLEERSATRSEQRLYTFLEEGDSEGVPLTRGELYTRARRIGAVLQELAPAGERAVLLYPPGAEYLTGFFGCLFSGLVAVPAYPPDPSRLERTLPRLRAIIQDSRATVVLTTSFVLSMAELLFEAAPDLKALRWVATDELAAGAESGWKRPALTGDSLAFLQYTSGSTGTPKGVMLSHANLLHNLELIRGVFQTREDSVGVIWLPPYHDMGLIGGILVPLYQGFHTALMSPLSFLKRPRSWLEALTRFGGTISGGPNFAFELCVRRIAPEEREGLDLSRWEVAFCGAEPIRAGMLDRFTEAFAPQGFRREAFYPCYGLAEATLIVSGGAKSEPPVLRGVEALALERGRAVEPSPRSEARLLVGCGETLGEQRIVVVEPESLQELPPGEVGEVWVSGPSVAQGYWQQPEESAATFRARTASGEGPFLRTGDLGFLDGGELYVTGRRKDLIILRGRNLYPQDLELTVEQSHAALRPGCGAAFGVDVDGEERLVVVQEVDPRKLDGATEELVGAIRQRLAEGHEVRPHALVLIEPGSLPKTSSGKVQRRACRSAYLANEIRVVHAWHALEATAPAPSKPSPAPRAASSELEALVLTRIAERLGARTESVDPDMPLTRLGLDSLAAVELAHGLEKTLGVMLPMETLLSGVSASELARELSARKSGARSPIPRAPRTGALPLSFAQQRLWFLDRLEPGSAFYNLPVVSRLTGALDVSALERSLQALARRHEALRTVFLEKDGEPYQHILDEQALPLAFVDLSGLSEDAREQEAQRLSREEAQRPFDLTRGPLLRATLLRLEAERHLLLLTLHHIIADGWSMRVLVRELEELHAAFSAGRTPALDALPIQFADYALWQRESLRGERLEDLTHWWKAHLAGAPPVLELPGDRARPRAQSYRGAQVVRRLEPAAWERVKTLARREGTTPFVTLLAGFQLLLHRYTGQEDIVVGVDTAHRARPETAGLIGLFVNQLPVRGNLAGAPTFRELLARLHQEALDVWAHQDLPFDELVRGLNPERSLAHAPVFQVKLVLQDAAPASLGRTGLSLESTLGDSGATKLDLTLSVTDTAHGLELLCEYATDLFDASTVSRMLGHLCLLLEGAASAPERRVSELPLLSQEERHLALVEWSRTAPAVPEDCAHRLFEEQVQRTPDATAVSLGESSLTYRELDARANQLAWHLRSLGVGPDVLVGIHLERTPEWVVAMLGVLKAGGAFLPLDTRYPPARLELMLREARVPVLISREELADSLGSQGELLVLLDAERSTLALQPETALSPAPAVTPSNLAYVIFTSGSTGTPKGTLLEHRGLCHSARALYEALGLRPGDRQLQLAAIGFDASLSELFSTLLGGAELVLAPPESLLPGPPLQQVLAEKAITAITATPTSLAALEPEALPRLRVVASAGEACTPELARRWKSGRRFLNAYGPTEVTICATVEHEVDSRQPSIGRAIPGAWTYVLDARMQPVPVGIPGELYVGGAGVARGYLHRPALTAERFVPNPFATLPGERLYRTGDLVRLLPDGRLEFLGRRDAQVKVRGVRVELGEVEAALGQYPGVRQAVVVPRQSEGETRLAAYVAAGAEVEPADLRRFLKERLPDAMVPSSFVRMDALPLAPGGKVDRQALPSPESVSAPPDAPFAGPRSELERHIADVWARVLEVPRVGLHDHFFEDLGGSSLTVVKASTQLRDALGQSIPVTHFFEHPTVSKLAARLERDLPASSSSEPAPRHVPSAEDGSGDIALIGMAGRFPGANDVHAFWENLHQGVESISRFAPEELEPSPLFPDALRDHPDFVPAGGVLEGADAFDARFFELSPREAQWMDPQQRLFLQCAWHALEDAGYDPERFPGPISLHAGAGTSSVHLLSLLGQTRKDPASLFEALGTTGGENVATKTAYKLGLRGESLNIYTACSTGLVAVHLACQSLRTRQSDLALAGAVKVSLPQRTGYLFQEGMILSPDGHCRAFDASARGTVLGNGLGVVVLKRLSDALRDGDHVYAVIKGSALNNDAAAKVSFTAPSVQGQSEVIARALASAGVDASSIGYVETHGTGTSLGDPIELAALTRAFRAQTDRSGYCAIGSVKTNIGHLDTAAGIAGLIKATLALHHGELPPSLHFERPNPEIDFERSPFFVNTAPRTWARGEGPRRASVSSFGIGGTNAHMVLEEAPSHDGGKGSHRTRQLVTLSARSASALEAMTHALAGFVEAHPAVDVADLAFTRNVGRKAFELRRTFVVEDATALLRALRTPGTASEVLDLEAARSRRVAFLFPGQGAQSVRMAQELYATEPLFQRELDACLALLPQAGLTEDLRPVLFPEPGTEARAETSLAEPRFALPALLSVEYALAKMWMGFGFKPSALLGHSFGEYAAACLSGVLSLEEALRLAVLRGELMSRLPPGGMLAVGLSAEEVTPLLSGELEIAALNGADRCTVSGPIEALESLERQLSARRVGVMKLATAYAFHSRAVEPVMAELERAVAGLTLNAPAIPFVSSLTGTWIRPEEATSPRYWARQMREPVRFASGLDTLVEAGCGWLIEAGPDQALTALARLRLRTSRETLAVPSLRRSGTSTSDAQTLLESMGALWRAGAAVDWKGFHAHERRQRLSLPGYPFEEKRLTLEDRPSLPLPAPTAAPVPAATVQPSAAAPVTPEAPAPRAAPGDVQRQLAELWRERLGVEHIGPDDSFLDLGGNSLMATQLLTRLRETFRVQIPLSDLFEAPTLAGLAARIEARLQVELPASETSTTAMLPVPRTGELPLSYVQARVWEMELREPGSSIFNEPLAVRISGALQPVLLERSFNEVIRRHESLRTVFHQVDGRAVPRILPEVRISLPVVDLRGFAGDREAEAMRLARLAPAAPFPLDRGPLVRVELVRMAEAEHVLLVTIHHIVADTLSLVNFIREAVALYTGFAHGQSIPLPELPIQYLDFAIWQQRVLADGSLSAQQAYWRKRLARRPGPLPLPLDRPRVASARRRGARHSFAFPHALGKALTSFSQREGLTPYMTLLAGYKALLARCSGQEDILVGTSIGNRTRPELEPQIGYVAHALALRTSLDGDPSFRALALRVRDTTLTAFAHPDVPYEQLLEELEPGEEAKLSRLFDAIFLLHTQDVSAPILEFPGLRLSYFEVTGLPAQYGTSLADLTLLMREDAQGFSGTLEYAVDLFDASSIARLLSQLEALLSDAMASPDKPLSQLSLEATPEQAASLVAGASDSASVAALLSAQAERTPDAVALRRGDQRLTWKALRAHALALASALRARGVVPGVPVAVCLEPSAERAVALWGVLASGGAYALVSREHWEDLSTLGLDGASPLLVTTASLPLPPGVDEKRVLRLSLSGELPAEAFVPAVDADGLACLVRETENREHPRVMWSHRNLLHRFAAMDARIETRPGETWLSASDASADSSGLELLWALARGLQVVFPAQPTARLVTLRSEQAAPRSLDFSLFYFANDTEASGRRKYQLLIDGAKFADAHGFSAVWTPERHFHAFGGPYPSPTATSAALAMVTERVSLRAGSVVLPLHDPIRVAEEWSVIDNLSDGRAGVSFATGWNANDFVFAPQNFHQRPEAIRRGVEEVRTLWRGGTVRRTNGTGNEVEISIRPRPVQEELPIWITAAFNPETFRLAGELGTGLLTNVLGLGQDFEELARKIALYREARRKAGHGRGHVVLMLHTFVASSQDEVKRQAREPLTRYFRSSVELFNGLMANQGLGINVRDLTPKDMEILLQQGVSRYLEAGGMFGTPETLAARVEQLRRADVDEVACLIDFGLGHEAAMEGLRHLDVLRRRSQEGQAPAPAPSVLVEADGIRALAESLRASPPAHLRCTPALAESLARMPDAAKVLGPVRTLVLDEADGLPVDVAETLKRVASMRVVAPMLPGTRDAALRTPRFVLDTAGRRAPVGVVGELFLGGDAAPLGFWKAPEMNRTRLRASPDGSDARVYGTGTPARYRADGEVEVLTPSARRRPAPVEPPAKPSAPVRAETPTSQSGVIARAPRTELLPLSYAQQRLWFLDQYQPGTALYNMPAAMRLKGALDVAALERAFAQVMRRHEALHTVFEAREGTPIQVISPTMAWALEVEELGHLPEPQRESEAMRLAHEEACRPFDLAHGPLLRARLLRLTANEHLLSVTMHHIVSDSWSVGVLIREVITLYASSLAGRPAPLPELPIQYADYAVWQREWLQGDVLAKQLEYWRKQLEGAPPALELPTDGPRSADTRYPGGSLRVELPLALTQKLGALCRREKGTLFMGLLAGLQVLLARYSGQDDICVGAPIAGRNQPQTEGLIGFFVNTLVLRSRLNGDPSFLEMLRQAREVTLAAYAHQDVPFEKLVEVLQPPRQPDNTPFFQVALVLLNTPSTELAIPGLTFRPVDVDNGTAKFDFTLVATETPRGLGVTMEYRSDLFEAATAARMMEHLRELLEDAVAHPERRLSELSLMSQAERHRMLVEWNGTTAEPPPPACVHEMFEAQAARTPDAVAVVFEGSQLTYAQLERRANQLAHALNARGVRPGDRVALCVERSLEMAVGLLAVLKAGAAYVPLDPTYPAERLAYMLEDSRVALVLTQSSLAASLAVGSQDRLFCVDTEAEALSRQPTHPPAHALPPESTCYIIYTSGSTGRPKGGALPHRALSNLMHWQLGQSVLATATTLQFSPLSFDVSFQETFATWCAGGTLVVPTASTRLDMPALLAFLVRHRVQRMFLPFVALQALADAVAHGAPLPTHMIEVVTAGEQLQVTPSLVSFFERLPGCVLENQYGPTEAHAVSAHRLQGPPATWPRLPPIGVPLPHTPLYVLDSHGQPCAVGVLGELYIGGVQLAHGYHDRPHLTAERFLPNPFSTKPGARMYRTGDRVHWRADGTIQYLGRLDGQVKIRGFRVEQGEVEAALHALPGVRDAGAVVREDAPGDKRLVGYVVLKPGVDWEPQELRQALARRLPEYMVPSALVRLDALPLTPSGKLARRMLPAPDADSLRGESPVLAPRTPLEQTLADAFSSVLGVTRLSITDNFFTLGGHSLIATRLVSRLRSSLGVELPLRELFESPTVEALARRIEARMPADAHGARAAVTVPRTGLTEAELSFAQQRLWFLDQYQPGTALYNMPAALRLEGVLDVAALERAFTELVRRHEVLRTTFQVREGKPVQVVAPAAPWTLDVLGLGHLPPAEREAEALRLAHEDAQRPFDLANGPLLRTKLLRLAERQYLLPIALHHIISDGWSIAVLIRDMVALYEASITGKPSPLPELSIQYMDYAQWQRGWLQGEVLEQQLGYWRKQLEGAPPALELPTDRPRTTDTRNPGASMSVELPVEMIQGLGALCQREGATLFMGLLAGLQALLARYSGQDDICVGAPIAGRTQTQTEDLVGFFVNTLVMRTRLDGNPSFRELLGRVKDVTLGAYAHQDVPFEKLVEVLQPPRQPENTPFFQVALVLLNTPTAELSVPGLDLRLLDLDTRTAKFDFTLTLRQEAQGLTGVLEYRSDLFESSTAARMMEHLRLLLKDAVAHPERRLSELSLMSDAERRQVLVEWNAPVADFPREARVHELFEAQAARTPDAVAVVFEQQQLTYAQLERRANQLAHALNARGVRPGDRVALCVERSLEMAVSVLGVLKAGAAYVPLDPAYPSERLTFMLEDTGAPLVLTQAHLTSSLPTGTQARVLCVDSEAEALSRQPAHAPALPLSPESTCYVIYTSGSTGRPKGVALPHRALCNLLHWQLRQSVLPTATTLQFASLSFDVSFQELFSTWCSGGTLVVPTASVRQDMPALLAFLVRHGVQRLFLPFVALQALADAVAHGAPLPSHLREVVTAGEQLQVTPSLVSLFERLPGCVLENQYGPSEAHVVSAHRLQGPPASWPRLPPIGSPLPHTPLYVLDAHGQPCAPGVPGELFIGGVQLALGYHARAALTAEKFVPNPFSTQPGARLYRTGDRARWRADGTIEYLGRLDGQVKVRGFRIEQGEVEAALRELPGVRDAAALVREDSPGDKRLVGYVVLQPDSTWEPQALRQSLARRLPEYMVPSALVRLEALPLTPSGKLARRLLPAPDADSLRGESPFVAPRTDTENKLAELWRELLGLKQVGVRDDFFALGGHSLMATRLLSRIRGAFQVEMPLQALFEARTLEEQAVRVEKLAGVDRKLQAPPLKPMPRQEYMPLSFAQQRLWFLDQLEPGRPTFNIPVFLRFEGALHMRALEHAFQEVVRRHEPLRTVILEGPEGPAQKVIPSVELVLARVDLRELPPEAREEEARRLKEVETLRPFDLSKGPLLRASLLWLENEVHLLMLTMHHIVSDGWSLGVLVREVMALYTAHREGQPAKLPALPVQYADYAAWQRQWLRGEVLEAQLDYWRRQLEGAPAVLELPADRPRPAVRSYRGGTILSTLSAELMRKLEALALRERSTLFMVLMAAFQSLMHRYTGQTDVVVGTDVANRGDVNTEPLIGFFINQLVLRLRLEGNPTFGELLAQARKVSMEATSHQDVPFEEVVRALNPERSTAHAPLFQVKLVLQNMPLSAPELPGLKLSHEEQVAVSSKLDLTVLVHPTAEGLVCSWMYSADLFEASTMERMARHFQRLLEGVVALGGERQRLSELPLLTNEERHRVLVDWNDTAAPYARRCIHELISEQAAKTPDAVAVVASGGQLTYAELERRANQLAHWLKSLGVVPETRVALFVERRTHALVGLLGILKAGGAYVPVDPSLARLPERVLHVLEDARVQIIVTEESLAEELPSQGAFLVSLDAEDGLLESQPEEAPGSTASPDNVAYVIYTSGSTGRPKGVCIEHGQLACYVAGVSQRLELPRGMSFASVSTLAADLGHTALFPTLCAGGTVHLVEKETASDAGLLAAYGREHRVDGLKIVPTHLEALLAAEDAQALLPHRRLVLGGDTSEWELVEKVHALVPECEVFNHYGPTETTVGVLAQKVERGERVPGAQSVPLGQPLGNVRVYVLDGYEQPVPPGVPGELFIGGASVGRGYLGRPELTAERFVPDRFGDAPGARLYRTGDRVRWLEGGRIEFLGRVDHQLKIRGYRVELGEVEAALGQHPGVGECVVVAREEASGSKQLVAYAVGKPGHALEERGLRQYLEERLPDYMVPAAFVVLESMPLTSNGKVDRKALPEPSRGQADEAYVAPRTVTEQRLAELWRELLGVPRVGAHDDFFELGGHSLLATQVVARVGTMFGARLAVIDLFEAPTLEKLAARIEAGTTSDSPLVTLRKGGSARPFFCVHPVSGNVLGYLELARRLDAEQPFYGLQVPASGSGETVEEMAARYLEAVREVQPEGPYLLGGWSMGGRVAYEMARQLEERGERVELLTVIDSLGREETAGAEASAETQVERMVFEFADYLSRVSGLHPRAAEVLEHVDAVELKSVLEGHPHPLVEDEVGEEARALWRLYARNRSASRTYVPKPYGGSLVVLRAAEGPEGQEADLGWGALARGGVEVHEVPGSHYTLIAMPHVEHLAARLGELLKRARTEGTRQRVG